jgi:hypothetical protein
MATNIVDEDVLLVCLEPSIAVHTASCGEVKPLWIIKWHMQAGSNSSTLLYHMPKQLTVALQEKY